MADIEKQIQELSEDLQELISITAQNADKSSINIITRFETFEKELEELNTKRWSAFKWSIGIALLILSILTPVIFMYLDRHSAQVLVDAQRISVIETNDKDQPSNKDIEKLVKDREVRFKDMELKINEVVANSKNFVTYKDIGQLKTDMYELVLKLNRDGEKRGGDKK